MTDSSLRTAAKRVLDNVGQYPSADYLRALTQLRVALELSEPSFECPDCHHRAEPCGGGFVNRDNPPEME
jgi:hypothetical protein